MIIIKIGIFDSGIGGLNVLNEILKKYPNNIYIYYGDTKNVPYGNKDKKEILKLSSKIVNFFIQKNVDMIIIACGTISSNCYSELKKISNVPIINIITPTIDYVNKKNYSCVGVFGTSRTINSHIFRNNLKSNVVEVETKEFATMIEKMKIDEKIIKKYIKKIAKCDALILGCTHYPCLKNQFLKYLNSNVEIIDMGVCLTENLILKNSTKFSLTLYFTKIDDLIIKNIHNIIKSNYEIIEVK